MKTKFNPDQDVTYSIVKITNQLSNMSFIGSTYNNPKTFASMTASSLLPHYKHLITEEDNTSKLFSRFWDYEVLQQIPGKNSPEFWDKAGVIKNQLIDEHNTADPNGYNKNRHQGEDGTGSPCIKRVSTGKHPGNSDDLVLILSSKVKTIGDYNKLIHDMFEEVIETVNSDRRLVYTATWNHQDDLDLRDRDNKFFELVCIYNDVREQNAQEDADHNLISYYPYGEKITEFRKEGEKYISMLQSKIHAGANYAGYFQMANNELDIAIATLDGYLSEAANEINEIYKFYDKCRRLDKLDSVLEVLKIDSEAYLEFKDEIIKDVQEIEIVKSPLYTPEDLEKLKKVWGLDTLVSANNKDYVISYHGLDTGGPGCKCEWEIPKVGYNYKDQLFFVGNFVFDDFEITDDHQLQITLRTLQFIKTKERPGIPKNLK